MITFINNYYKNINYQIKKKNLMCKIFSFEKYQIELTFLILLMFNFFSFLKIKLKF